ncbi:MAG: hypothetical protein LIO77_09995 [Rikenellaceae bacterium]|nr:hypothetical protein [Rikenellaceae bacterium]
MKKKIVTILFPLLVLAAISCTTVRTNKQYNDPPGYITMEIVPPVVDAKTSVVTLMISNHSDQTAQFGANYTIEKFTGTEWREFDRPQFAVIAIMYMLGPGETREYDINLFPDQADYTPGRYRIVKSIVLDLTGDTYYTAEFRVE